MVEDRLDAMYSESFPALDTQIFFFFAVLGVQHVLQEFLALNERGSSQNVSVVFELGLGGLVQSLPNGLVLEGLKHRVLHVQLREAAYIVVALAVDHLDETVLFKQHHQLIRLFRKNRCRWEGRYHLKSV